MSTQLAEKELEELRHIAKYLRAVYLDELRFEREGVVFAAYLPKLSNFLKNHDSLSDSKEIRLRNLFENMILLM